MSKRANQLTVGDLRSVASALNSDIPVGEELLGATVELLKGKDINDVSELIQSSDAIEELIVLVKGGLSAARQLQERRLSEGEAPQSADNETSDFEVKFIS